MVEHKVDLRVTTACGDEWIGCACGWISPPLHGTGVANAAFFLHSLDVEELPPVPDENPYLAFF